MMAWGTKVDSPPITTNEELDDIPITISNSQQDFCDFIFSHVHVLHLHDRESKQNRGAKMIEYLKSLFKSDPGKKIIQERDRLYEISVQQQRNGDLRAYGETMARIDELEKEYVKLTTNEESND